MAGTLNKVILIGRLGADPEVRYSPDGSAIVNFNMATNEPVRVGESWEERPEWHKIVVFGKPAEFCANYLSKGRLVCVEGKLKTEQWEDAQGVKRYTTKIVAREVHSLSSPGERTPQTQSSQAGMESSGGFEPPEENRSLPEELPPSAGMTKEEDIPF